MPRVILRTVEPAKELACQSVEKRCTRAKASRATSDMILQRERHDRLQAGQPQDHRHQPQRHDGAECDKRRMPRRRIVCPPREGVDQMAGEHRHEQVGRGRAQQTAGDNGRAARLIEPVPEHERDHHANRGGTVFGSNGHGLIRHRSRARRLHLMDARAAERRMHASLKIGNSLGSLGIGTSGPIGTGEKSAQEARSPGESIERGRTICEYIEIMQILPGSSDNAALINASRTICNITNKSEQTLVSQNKRLATCSNIIRLPAAEK